MQIPINIPDEKVQRAATAIIGLFPIPLDDDGNPLFTEYQWAKKQLIRVLIDWVYQYESKLASEAVTRDDSIAS